MVSDYRKNQWEERAQKTQGYSEYVTDTDLSVILGIHDLKVKEGDEVLVIGVGWGLAIKQLVEMGVVVYGLDVSKKLLDNAVSLGADRVALFDDIKCLPPVDFAVCHLVLQHNLEGDVFKLINDVNLKSNGIGSYQYSTLEKGCVLTDQMIIDFNEGEQFFYSKERMERILEKTNKKKVFNETAYSYRDENYSFDWNVLKFRSK